MTPDEWNGSEWVPLHVLAQRHDHKGHSEEMCIRCGWIMGHIPLNCQNNDTPHVFPSQQAEIERLRTALEVAANHMSMTGAPQTTIDAIRNAVRGG
jgi:hypothetical protein